MYTSLVNINAYHQLGLEAGKKAAADVLNTQNKVRQVLIEAGTALSLEEIAEKMNAMDEIENIYKILWRLDANDRRVKIEGNASRIS